MGTRQAPAAPNRHPAGTRSYLALSLWARACGRSPYRAHQVCELGYVPEAIPYAHGRGMPSFIIPAGTPWPKVELVRGAPIPPLGYELLTAWARKQGRSHTVAHIRLKQGRIPEAIEIGPTGGHWAVPEGLPWPAKATGRPRKHHPQGGAPGSSQGAGESLGALPAPIPSTPSERNPQ